VEWLQQPELGRVVAQVRGHIKVSQAQLAAGIGVNREAVNAWENARHRPGINRLQGIAEYAGVPVEVFTVDGPSLDGDPFQRGVEYATRRMMGVLRDLMTRGEPPFAPLYPVDFLEDQKKAANGGE
jgi:transcriptional regulator with XRE-family HTH domain